jgi:hypothetical protein
MTSPENPSDPLSGTGRTQMQGTSHTQSGAETTQGEGGHLTERARRIAGELAGDLKRKAEESAEDMRQRARSAVDQQKDTAAGSKSSHMRCVARRMIYANGGSPWPPSIRAKSPTGSRAWRIG